MKREKKQKINKAKVALLVIVVAMVIALIGLGVFQIRENNLAKKQAETTSNDFLQEEITERETNQINAIAGENVIKEANDVANEVESNKVENNQVISTSAKPTTQGSTGNSGNSGSSSGSGNSSSSSSSTPTYKNSGIGGLPVLMYHFFYNESAGEKPRDNNFMEISAFESQLKYLTDNNFYFPTWQEVEDYIDGKKNLPAKSIVITVDDGDESFFRLALPVIEKYDVKVTEFLVTSWNGWFCNDYKSSKMSYQSHSDQMHQGGANGKGVLLSWSYDQIYKDLTESKRVLNGEATVFCYPFGQYNETSKKILKDAGYKLAFTTQGRKSQSRG